MRKKLAILLICLHLFGNTEAGQVFKMPVLLQHYKQHCENNKGLGFIEFIIMHYAGDDGTHTDDEQDQQLPCHNLQQHTMHLMFAPMLNTVSESVAPAPASARSSVFITTGIPQSRAGRLWQPPRY